MAISTLMFIYMAGWLLAFLSACVLLVRDWKHCELSDPRYWRFITHRWKWVTFAMAALPLTILAPYSGDPTWDYVDGAFMSILAYITAPWSVGVVYRFFRGWHSSKWLYVAVCIAMFSLSWSYDGYILLKMGFYPPTWWSNILLSGVMYLSAGMFWNLQWQSGRGVTFAFMEKAWFENPASQFGRLIIYAGIFMLLVTAICLPFFWDHLMALFEEAPQSIEAK